MEVIFRRDPLIYDGSRANNGWLQETPEADHESLLGQCGADEPQYRRRSRGWRPATSSRSTSMAARLKGPIWPQPGHPDNSITVFLGYGRTKAGRVGNDVGFNAYKIRTSDAPWMATAKINKVGAGYGFAHPQGFQYIDYSDLPKGTEPLKQPAHHSQGDACRTSSRIPTSRTKGSSRPRRR